METRKATRSGPHAANGLVIWRARKRKGLTQEQLAEAAQISRIQMIKLENGMHLPKPATRDRIAEAVGIKAEAIKCEEAALSGDKFRNGAGPDARGRDRARGRGEGRKRAGGKDVTA